MWHPDAARWGRSVNEEALSRLILCEERALRQAINHQVRSMKAPSGVGNGWAACARTTPAGPQAYDDRTGTDAEAWMAEATHSGIEALARFARKRQDDLIAVTGGLTLERSQTHVRSNTRRMRRKCWVLRPCDAIHEKYIGITASPKARSIA